MAASLLKKVPQNLWSKVCWSRLFLPRHFSDSSKNAGGETITQNPVNLVSESELSTPTEGALRKFDKMVEKVRSKQTESETDNVGGDKSEELNESFATMIRNSRLVALGEDENKRVSGKIIEVMDDDLYIDFGGKFHCVCPRPRKNGELYQRGKEVIVSLKTQEMSSAFLGSDVHITLLEADATLLGLQSNQ